MKRYIPLFSMLILACFFTACAIQQDDVSKSEVERTFDYGPRTFPEDCTLHEMSDASAAIPLVFMEVELVNNIGSEIAVLTPGGLHIGPGYEPNRDAYGFSGVFPARRVRHTAEGFATNVFKFQWVPHERLWSYGNQIPGVDFSCPKCGFYVADGDKFKEMFRPYMRSFFLEIQVDGEAYYLAGWPQSFTNFSTENLDWFYLNEQNRKTRMEEGKFDRSRIIQYGIGFSDNTEVFVDERGFPAHHYTIEYVDDAGRAAKYNAGVPLFPRDGNPSNWVKGKAATSST